MKNPLYFCTGAEMKPAVFFPLTRIMIILSTLQLNMFGVFFQL